MGFSRKDQHRMSAEDGLAKLNRNTSTPNPNSYNPNLSSLKNHNNSYIYHGPQVHTVRESITSSTNATFLVYQCPNSSILVKQPGLHGTVETAQRFCSLA
ncbi:uncharacterized protein LOC18028556 [Eutrema salsugineum]|uniref:uncharacterized protein LOC18028556 n=1 Tax=Eutrema salsugineum TaxID=72664 RepID=UPI000CECE686|nr:uncharacterized protein LOC18028556 [Eutrema salsugineum]